MADLLLEQHLTWINHLQPEGLVVAAHTLVDADIPLRTDSIVQQRQFLEFLSDDKTLQDIPAFLEGFLGWPKELIATESEIPDSLRVALDAFADALAPTIALRTPPRWSEAAETPFQLLVRVEPDQTDFDKLQTGAGWQKSAHARLERLLRETQVPIGLLVSPQMLRLVYAPRGENAGHLTFRFADLTVVAGRAMLGALEMLLGQNRLISAATNKRLPALLKASRNAQALVSAELSQQVLASLYELLRGFAQADAQAKGQLLSHLVAQDPQTVYQGLLSVLLRLVFLLYAEDRGLMPLKELYQKNYSVHGLWLQLRDDAAQYPDTMDRRPEGWARLLALFKAVYDGNKHPDLDLPPRLGHLFDPKRFPFLEGPQGEVPWVPDSTLYRILENLLVLKGEKLSYRTLDVEQIGSVYESIMGFSLVTVSGLSLALKPTKKHGAPPVLDLAALLPLGGEAREKKVLEETDRKLNGNQKAALRAAKTVDALLDLFRDWQDVRATPHPIPAGGWILVPTEERRKSGSHYTPRSLTEPVVRKALEPVWLRLGPNPTPEALLDLKFCDPAMGSGAFLVELCRQLAERLVESWNFHNLKPKIPDDEDELLHARRIVAQRCLYGVDRNPMAVDLAKLSLWLATLAKDHPFTFLDHSLRAGDSLVGLSLGQMTSFHWDIEKNPEIGNYELLEMIRRTHEFRLRILNGGDDLLPEMKAEQLRRAESSLSEPRLAADLTIAAFFGADKTKAREELRYEYNRDWSIAPKEVSLIPKLWATAAALRSGKSPVTPFHWELEFPEVFFPGLGSGDRKRRGFDAFVGNPPFAGKNTIASGNHPVYLDWLKALHEESHGNADLSAHFFRRSFDLVRDGGSLGLIATNSIAQGDTRSTGLRWIRNHDGRIYNANRRIKWPGEAAVVVSVVHVFKGEELPANQSILLDNKPVEKITAFLFHDGGDENPATLMRNADKSFIGSYVLGMGFTFDNTNPEATTLDEMQRLIESNPRNQERIFPYIGGEEVNDSPKHAHHRYVINFGEMPLCRAHQAARWTSKGGAGIVADDFEGPVAADWPDLLAIVEAKVKPERLQNNREGYRKYWWLYGEKRVDLIKALVGKDRVLAISQVSQWVSFAFLSTSQVYSHRLVLFPSPSISLLAQMQSRIHELWCRFFSYSLEERFAYGPSDCFETFPFLPGWEANPVLEQVGREYHDFRAALMVRHNEGLTKTYNRFHDPDHDGSGIEGTEPEAVRADIVELRRLHNELDRAVLAAYGWTGIDATCEFLLDYEEDESEAPSKGKGRKKPWRLRFPDPVRDEILARLLALNAHYASEEGQILSSTGAAAKPAKKSPSAKSTHSDAPPKPRKPKPGNEAQGSLL